MTGQSQVWAEVLHRLERLERCEKDASEWKKAADIVGERLIATEERLEKCEALILALLDTEHVMKNELDHDDNCPACKAELAARAALEKK